MYAQDTLMKKMFDLISQIYDDKQILSEICLLFSVELSCSVYVSDAVGSTLFEIGEDRAHELFANLTCGMQNLGSVIIKRDIEPFSIDDEQAFFVLAAVLSLLLRAIDNHHKENTRRVKSALGSLSYSELTAALHVFDVLGYESGRFVSSDVSKEKQISKSAVVNCLKKLESAGLIEVRSLGVKGTHVRVLNDALPAWLAKLKRG